MKKISKSDTAGNGGGGDCLKEMGGIKEG
jgi:hypothetical protein